MIRAFKSQTLIVGLSSLPGGGKDFIADILIKDYKFYKVSPGELVRGFMKKYGKEITREKQQNIQKQLRKKYGNNYIMELCHMKISRSGKRKIVIPGIRLPTDITFYKKRFDGNFINIFIYAPKKLRYKRLVNRKREDAPENYADFIRHDARETDMFDLDTTKKMSDASIVNDGTKEHVKTELKRILKDRLKV